VKTVVTKMGGLQVYIQNNDRSMRNFSSFASGSLATQTATVLIVTVCAPADLTPLIPFPSTTGDSKVYLRQNKKDYFIRNQGPPGWMRYTYFKVRRSIAASDFTSYTNLINNQSIATTNWAAPLTIGNPAQRYLKFGKTKLVKMNQGALLHVKLNAKFGAKALSSDVEQNTLYLGTRLTKGIMFKWIPGPITQLDSQTVPTAYTGLRGAPYQIDILEQEYLSGYNVGENDPTSQMTNVIAATGFIDDIMLPGYQHWLPTVG